MTGEGARPFGGRSNTCGQAIIYAAETVAGALLKILVHGKRQLGSHYVVYRLVFPKRIVAEIQLSVLPQHWRSAPPPAELGQIGDRWCSEQTSAMLRVPSAVVPLEANYLINPAHRDHRLIQIEGPIDDVMDERLV